jgi:hypothetical protein
MALKENPSALIQIGLDAEDMSDADLSATLTSLE